MKIWIHVFIFAVSSLAVCSQTCSSEHFPAVFTATIEQTTTSPGPVDDPELWMIHGSARNGLRDWNVL